MSDTGPLIEIAKCEKWDLIFLSLHHNKHSWGLTDIQGHTGLVADNQLDRCASASGAPNPRLRLRKIRVGPMERAKRLTQIINLEFSFFFASPGSKF